MIECIKTNYTIPSVASTKYENAVLLFASQKVTIQPGTVTLVPTDMILRHNPGFHLEAFLVPMLDNVLTLLNDNVAFPANNFQSYNLSVRSKLAEPITINRGDPLVDVVVLHDIHRQLKEISPRSVKVVAPEEEGFEEQDETKQEEQPEPTTEPKHDDHEVDKLINDLLNTEVSETNNTETNNDEQTQDNNEEEETKEPEETKDDEKKKVIKLRSRARAIKK